MEKGRMEGNLSEPHQRSYRYLSMSLVLYTYHSSSNSSWLHCSSYLKLYADWRRNHPVLTAGGSKHAPSSADNVVRGARRNKVRRHCRRGAGALMLSFRCGTIFESIRLGGRWIRQLKRESGWTLRLEEFLGFQVPGWDCSVHEAVMK